MRWKAPRELGWKGKFAIIIILIVIVAALLLYVNAGYNYANVGYRFDLSATESLYNVNPANNSGNYLQVYYWVENSGTIDAVPRSTISVVNATIWLVYITGVASSKVHDYCQNNSTLATISNLTVGGTAEIRTMIFIIPNTGVPSFSVSASATLPWDLLHWRNTIQSIYPTVLFYNQTSPNEYVLDNYH